MSVFGRISPLVHKEARTIASLALPLIAGQLSAMSMNLIDVLLAGHLGAQVLGPVAVGSSIWLLAIVSVMGVMMALPASVAHMDGAGRRPEVWRLFRQALWLALAVGIVLMLVEYQLGPWLIQAIGVTPDLVRDATAFLHAIAAGAPALAILFACRGLSEGLSMPRPSFYFSLLGPALLAPLGYVLMYGKFGIPAMGVVGSGLATAIVCWIQAIAFLVYVCVSDRYLGLGREVPGHAPDWSAILGLMRIGGPMGVTLMMEGSLFIVTALVIGRLGEHAVAMHQIALSVASLAFMVPLGLSMAITVRVAHAKGRGDPAGVRRAAFVGFGMTLLTQTFSCSLMLAIPGVIVSFYTHDPAIIGGAVLLLRLAGLFQLSDGLQVAANGALRGLKDTRMPMIITLFAYWIVGMPVGIWLSIPRGYGAAGMWIGLLVGLTMAAALLLTRFHRATRQRYKHLPAKTNPGPSA